ncbi:PPE family protein, partial [Mycobacterium intermedium]
MNFATLPPEINSLRMFAGAGVGPMLSAAAAWDDLAEELAAVAESFGEVTSGLSGGAWQGPASVAMAEAATPYVSWLNTVTAQAEQASAQARNV